MGLTADEKKLLEELTAKDAEPDADETYEVEVYDTANGRGARLPYGQAKTWLFESFGIGTPPAPEKADKDPGGQSGQGGQPSGGTGYFGRRAG